MEAGKLDALVTIESRSSVQNATTGIVTDNWTQFARVWASIKPAGEKDAVSGDGQTVQATAKMDMRYLAGVLPSMRVVDGAAVYEIVGVPPETNRRRESMTLTLRAQVNG